MYLVHARVDEWTGDRVDRWTDGQKSGECASLSDKLPHHNPTTHTLTKR